MELFLIFVIVFLSLIYIFLYIKKVLTKGENNPRCANCPAMNSGNLRKKHTGTTN